MNDRECVAFLQWALPRLGMRWPGFRKVRRQVCRRVGRRLHELRLPTPAAYRDLLRERPEEWSVLDALCRVTISRFYRDRGTFDRLRDDVIPSLAATADRRGIRELRAWSVGCASGEEPYTLRILWELAVAERFPQLRLHVLGTDADARLLDRARAAVYPASSLWELPAAWRQAAFEPIGDASNPEAWRLKDAFRDVRFATQDVRRDSPGGAFHLVACRNLVFTYYDENTQREVLQRLAPRIHPGGALVLGCHEEVPEGVSGFEAWPGARGTYRWGDERLPDRSRGPAS